MKRTPIKRRKTGDLAKKKHKADELWSKIVRYVGCCAVCGATDKQLHAHHLIGRSNALTRWDVSNGICLCAGCHTMSPRSAHRDPLRFAEWLQANLPNRYDWARRNMHNHGKPDIDSVLESLKQIAAQLSIC